MKLIWAAFTFIIWFKFAVTYGMTQKDIDIASLMLGKLLPIISWFDRLHYIKYNYNNINIKIISPEIRRICQNNNKLIVFILFTYILMSAEMMCILILLQGWLFLLTRRRTQTNKICPRHCMRLLSRISYNSLY